MAKDTVLAALAADSREHDVQRELRECDRVIASHGQELKLYVKGDRICLAAEIGVDWRQRGRRAARWRVVQARVPRLPRGAPRRTD